MDNFWLGKRVVVTGAGGIAGQNTVRELLKRGAFVYAVEGIKRKLYLKHENLVNFLFINLLKYENCLTVTANADIVLNLAAVIKGAKGQKTGQLQLVRDNVTLGVNMITAAVENKVKRFGFVGSSTMYPPFNFVDESQGFEGEPWEGYTGVGNMKRYLERVCMQFHKESDTKFAIARTTALYGPYDDFNLETCHVIPALVNKISHKQNPLEVWGDGSERRNFIYVEDFVDGFLKMVEEHAEGDPINITSGEEATVNNVISYATKHVGYVPDIRYDMTKPTMIPRRIVSVKKAQEILNWEAKTSLQEGIQKTIDWFKQNYSLGDSTC